MKKRPSMDEIEVEAARVNLKQPLGRFLILLSRQFEDELLSGLKNLGYESITAADFNVIRNIDPRGNSANRIAELAGVTKQAISKQISRLEDAGLIERRYDSEDQRVKVLAFTKKGEKFIHQVFTLIQRIENRYIQILGGKRKLDKLKSDLHSLLR